MRRRLVPRLAVARPAASSRRRKAHSTSVTSPAQGESEPCANLLARIVKKKDKSSVPLDSPVSARLI
jgi:hypothetical protein